VTRRYGEAEVNAEASPTFIQYRAGSGLTQGFDDAPLTAKHSLAQFG
jgi:hypothetical protein